MATSSGDSLEKLEDMIVRAAETTAKHVAAAKEAIGAVIFGQDKVIEQALITLLCGGHALLIGLPGLEQAFRSDVCVGQRNREANAGQRYQDGESKPLQRSTTFTSIPLRNGCAFTLPTAIFCPAVRPFTTSTRVRLVIPV